MNRESLLEKRAAVETEFNALQDEKKAAQAKISEMDTELVKLQGKYQAYTEIIDAEPQTETTGTADPNTIVAEEGTDGES